MIKLNRHWNLFRNSVFLALLISSAPSFACFKSDYSYVCIDSDVEPEQHVVLLSDHFCSDSDYRHTAADIAQAAQQMADFKSRGREIADKQGWNADRCYVDAFNIEK